VEAPEIEADVRHPPITIEQQSGPIGTIDALCSITSSDSF